MRHLAYAIWLEASFQCTRWIHAQWINDEKNERIDWLWSINDDYEMFRP